MDELTRLRHNHDLWTEVNRQFSGEQGMRMWQRTDVVWGLFATPEDQLGVLGELAGRDVVELGCGTGFFGAWLARRGARVVGVDLSAAQLGTARSAMARYGPAFPLVQANAERLPLVDECVDLVLSEHGVAAWCDPRLWVPEAARVLRPGGRLVFLTNSLISALCVPADGGPATDRLQRGVRDVRTVCWPGGGHEFHPSHGDWIELLGRAGLQVVALRELYAPQDAEGVSFYQIADAGWASSWPAEELWVAAKPS